MENLLRPPPIESLEAYKYISPDSGYPTVIHSHYNARIKAHVPPDPPLQELTLAKDRDLMPIQRRRHCLLLLNQLT